MASPMATKGVAIAVVAGVGLTASAFASAAPRSKAQTQFKSVHGTAKQTQHGFVDKEPAMDGLDVRKVVQGKNPNDNAEAVDVDDVDVKEEKSHFNYDDLGPLAF